MKKVLSETQLRRLDDAPVKSAGIVRRAYRGSASPRVAIKAFCLQCVGYLREDVKNCSADGCPLWMYHPYQDGEDDEGEDDAENTAG
jgi:hypothetical protein